MHVTKGTPEFQEIAGSHYDVVCQSGGPYHNALYKVKNQPSKMGHTNFASRMNILLSHIKMCILILKLENTHLCFLVIAESVLSARCNLPVFQFKKLYTSVSLFLSCI